MTVYIILAAVILTATALILMPVGLDARYMGGKFSLTGRAGPVPVQIIPREKITEKELEKDAEKEGETLLDRLPSPPVLRLLIENGGKAAGRILCSVQVKVLRACFIAGGPDPYAAAMAYARAGVAMDGIARWAQGRVERAELRAGVDFDSGKAAFEGEMELTARLGRILYIAACFGIGFLRGYFRCKKTEKTEG